MPASGGGRSEAASSAWPWRWKAKLLSPLASMTISLSYPGRRGAGARRARGGRGKACVRHLAKEAATGAALRRVGRRWSGGSRPPPAARAPPAHPSASPLRRALAATACATPACGARHGVRHLRWPRRSSMPLAALLTSLVLLLLAPAPLTSVFL